MCNIMIKLLGAATVAMGLRGWAVCRMLGVKGGAPIGEKNGQFGHGARGKDTIAARKLANLLQRIGYIVLTPPANRTYWFLATQIAERCHPGRIRFQ